MPQVTSPQTSTRAAHTHTESDLTSTSLPEPRSGTTSELRASIMLASSQKTAQEQQKADRIATAIGAGVIRPEMSKEDSPLSQKKNSDLDFLSITTRDKLLQKAEELGLIPDALTHPLSNETNLKKIDAANKELLQIVKAEEQFREDLERMKEKSLIPPDALAKILEIQDPVARNQALEPYRKLEEIRRQEIPESGKEIPIEGSTARIL